MHGVPPDLPVEVRPDRTLRVKITDACGLACTFCHNEGTPVTADNLGKTTGEFTGSPGRTGRVSIYLRTNGAVFLPARITPDTDFALALAAIRGSIDTHEVHFTGGEPTLHPQLPELVALAHRLGLTVGITSNGENGAAVLPDCAAAGLDRINLSVFGTTPQELAAVQARKNASTALAKRKLTALRNTIDHLGAVPVRHIVTTCRFNNDRDCQEGYYGVRLYRARNGPYMVGVCIQRMDLCLPLGQFVMSQLCREVQTFRDDERARLTTLHQTATNAAS